MKELGIRREEETMFRLWFSFWNANFICSICPYLKVLINTCGKQCSTKHLITVEWSLSDEKCLSQMMLDILNNSQRKERKTQSPVDCNSSRNRRSTDKLFHCMRYDYLASLYSMKRGELFAWKEAQNDISQRNFLETEKQNDVLRFSWWTECKALYLTSYSESVKNFWSSSGKWQVISTKASAIQSTWDMSKRIHDFLLQIWLKNLEQLYYWEVMFSL